MRFFDVMANLLQLATIRRLICCILFDGNFNSDLCKQFLTFPARLSVRFLPFFDIKCNKFWFILFWFHFFIFSDTEAMKISEVYIVETIFFLPFSSFLIRFMNLMPILCEDDENIFVFDSILIAIEISQVALK